MKNWTELMKNRRSIRDYQDKPVEAGLLTEIVKDACQAPSSGNGQSWRFIVITNRDFLKRLSDESKANMVARIEADPNTYVARYEAAMRDPGFNVFYNAPAMIVICGPADTGSLTIDCSLAASYLMLSAAARGLGTCWIGLGTALERPETLQEMGLPEGYRIVAPIIVGYPREIPAPTPRQDPQILKLID